MALQVKTIGIVAPGRALTRDIAARVEALATGVYGDRLSLIFHDQCFLSAGHFAGDDDSRGSAFVEMANDPAIDAVWFARGGYGACRLPEKAFSALNEAAGRKLYVGYSDAGAILARLYGMGFQSVAHGPMPADILRERGEEAVERALRYIAERDPAAVAPGIPAGKPTAAFNITMLAHLVGTPWLSDLSEHVLILEDVAEYLYRIDRALFTITSSECVKNVAGIMLGRCSEIPENDIDFGADEEEITRYWCARSGIAYLGRADIGHDADNKIVPYGLHAAGA